ncbi:MAG: type II toxin-antitoxin system YhaV family toxin [Burkholderiaceae bacterium]
MIVFAWVNDEDTKRAYESSDDAYRVFRRCSKRPSAGRLGPIAGRSAGRGERLQRFAAGVAP